MKKGLLFILMVGASVCLSAQEKGKTEGKAYTVETNRFGANWFISGGVGGQMYFGDNDGKADFGKRIAPALDIAVGKWFTPGIGLRVAYNGLQAKGAAPSASTLYTKGGTYSNGYYKQKWNMANFHGDVLFNLSNMFCGYNEDIHSLCRCGCGSFLVRTSSAKLGYQRWFDQPFPCIGRLGYQP